MSTSWECIAFDGERVPHEENFFPGPDNCTACKCEKGKARFCRAVLCQHPQDCKSFRIGESCCDFICLDDILPTYKDGGHGGPSDAGLRMVASAITAFLSLALLLFLIHRLRQRKLRTAQHQYFEDQLDALGGLPSDSCQSNPCCHNAIYLSGNDHVDFFLDGHTPPFSPWKPRSYYFQPGDAPPPYSEVMANDRVRSEGPLPSLNPLMVQLSPPSESSQEPHGLSRPFASQRNSTLVFEGPSQTTLEHREPDGVAVLPVQPNPASNATLLSDEVYENSSVTEDAERVTRPHSLQNPPLNSLNDLNRGTNHNPSRSSKVFDPDEGASSSAACKESSCQCECRHNVEKCNVCSAGQQPTVPERSAVKKACQISSETERASAVEDFRLRLRLDISSSSTSTEGTSQPFSLGSASSRSSDDVPSIEGSTEATC